jgi:hypothetical protein
VAYYDDGSQDLLVNTIGSYQGAVLIRATGGVYLEVDANGPWTATIEAIGPDPAAAQGASGHGDYVSGTFAPTRLGHVPYAFSNNGSSNFAVWLRCEGGDDLIANEIGSVSGEVVAEFETGPCLWEVQSQGDWNIRPK